MHSRHNSNVKCAATATLNKCQNHENSIKLSCLVWPNLVYQTQVTSKANPLVLSWAQKIRQKYFGGASKGPGLLKDSIFAPSKPQASNIWAIFACKPRLNHLNLFKNMIRLNRLMVQNHDDCSYTYFYLYLLCRYLGPCMATKRYPHHLPVRPNKGRLFLRNSIQTQKHNHIRRKTQKD